MKISPGYYINLKKKEYLRIDTVLTYLTTTIKNQIMYICTCGEGYIREFNSDYFWRDE